MSMKQGVFVGQHECTGANLLMIPDGLCRGVGLHRLPQDLHWDAEFLSRCRGLPWEAKPIRRGRPDQQYQRRRASSSRLWEQPRRRLRASSGGGTS